MKLKLNGVEIAGLSVNSYSYGNAYKSSFWGHPLRVLDLSVDCKVLQTCEDSNCLPVINFFSDGQVNVSKESVDFDIRVLAHTVLTATPVDKCLELISAPISIEHLTFGTKYAPQWHELLSLKGVMA